MHHDLSNAFGSTDWETLGRSVDERLICEEDAHLAHQRFTWSSIQVRGSDRQVSMRPQCGALMGDPFAVETFAESYAEPLEVFCELNLDRQGSVASELEVILPFTGDCIDLSTTNFADDTQRLVLAQKGEDLGARSGPH